VCTPTDAVRAWRTSEVDALLLGPYLVERSAIS
jgi:predicted NodU family carbamoyl transferase